MASRTAYWAALGAKLFGRTAAEPGERYGCTAARRPVAGSRR